MNTNLRRAALQTPLKCYQFVRYSADVTMKGQFLDSRGIAVGHFTATVSSTVVDFADLYASALPAGAETAVVSIDGPIYVGFGANEKTGEADVLTLDATKAPWITAGGFHIFGAHA